MLKIWAYPEESHTQIIKFPFEKVLTNLDCEIVEMFFNGISNHLFVKILQVPYEKKCLHI